MKSFSITLKFSLKSYHSQYFILDGRIWNRSSSLFLKNSWTIIIFLVTRLLNSSLLNINLLIYFGPLLATMRNRNNCIDMLCDWFLWDSLSLCFGIIEVSTISWTFGFYWEVFPMLIIGVVYSSILYYILFFY